MAELKQYGVLIVGLLMAGGFAFGGMASYSSMVNTQGGNDDQLEAELPSQTYKEGPYNLTPQQRMYLSIKHDVVIVSAIYNSTEDKEQLTKLKSVTDNFNGRAYLSVVEASESEVANSYSLTQYPKVLMFGYKTSRRRTPAAVNGEINEENVKSAICGSMNKWGQAAAYCSS